MIHRMPGYIFKLEKNTHFYPLQKNPALNWVAQKSGCSNKSSASGFWCVFFLCALNETAVSYFFPPLEALAVGHTVTQAQQRQVFDCFTVNSESIELCLRITFLITSTFSCSGHVALLQHFWLWLSPLKWIIRANQAFFHPEVAAASLQSVFFGLWSVTLIDF